mgnify:CR=1 FL=1
MWAPRAILTRSFAARTVEAVGSEGRGEKFWRVELTERHVGNAIPAARRGSALLPRGWRSREVGRAGPSPPFFAGAHDLTPPSAAPVPRLTLWHALDLVVQRGGSSLDEAVSLCAKLEDVGARDRLGDEDLEDRGGDAGGSLVLVQRGGSDCARC